jgi:hypothetical protein
MSSLSSKALTIAVAYGTESRVFDAALDVSPQFMSSWNLGM